MRDAGAQAARLHAVAAAKFGLDLVPDADSTPFIGVHTGRSAAELAAAAAGAESPQDVRNLSSEGR